LTCGALMITLLFRLLCKADHRPFHPLKVLRKAHFHKKIKNIFPVRLLQHTSGVFAREKSEYRSQEPECA
jgi:hypothetical protein